MLNQSVAQSLAARAILTDYWQSGEEVWRRFNASKADQLTYCRALVTILRRTSAPTTMVDELDQVVPSVANRF